MDDTGNGEKVQVTVVKAPTEADSQSSAPRARRSTRPALTAAERLEILQQAVVDLASVGIETGAAELYQDGHCLVAIYLIGVHLDNGRLVAIAAPERSERVNGKEG